MVATMQLLRSTDPAALEAVARSGYVRSLQAAQQVRDAGRTLWITPTARSRRATVRQLAQQLGPVCVAPGVVTFEQFADQLLEAAGQPATALSSMARRLILRRLVRQAVAENALPSFAAVAHTVGFLDIVEGFIAELKRDEIWPDQFLNLCQRHSATSARDREIGRLYQQYQDVLLERNWYDAEGRFWLARTALVEGQCQRLPDWTHVAVVGFSDFTPPQLEILEVLSRRSDRFVLTLPAAEDTRRDVFTKPLQTGESWRRKFPHTELLDVETTATESPSRGAIRRQLFGNLRACTPMTADGIEIVAATGPESELSAVAWRIKQLLEQGFAPEDVVVGVSGDALPWANGLVARGLPAWCDVGPPLKEAGLVKFLVAVLLAEGEDWPFHRLQAVLNSSYFRPSDDVATDFRQVATSLRRLRLSSDRRAILQILPLGADSSAPADVVDDEDAVLGRDRNWPAVHAAAGRALRWYARVTEPLRSARSLTDWLDVLAEVVRKLGAVRGDSVDPLDVADAALWERLQRTLRDAAAAEVQSASSPVTLDLAEFLAELRDLLAREFREPATESPGMVRVLHVEQVRHLNVPVLFLVGLTEDRFPSRRGDDCLFPDAERRRLAAAGLPLRHAQHQQQDELFLFFTLLQRWQQHLFLTYSAVNAKGQPTFPSPYVTALRAVFHDDSLPVTREGQLDPIPDAQHLLTSADQRLAAWTAARAGQAGWLKSFIEQPAARRTAANVAAAVDMAVQRFDTPGFTAYEGRLAVDANRQAIARRFGGERQFSATELEAYANCPFRFWLETGLGIEPLGSVEAGTDHRERGSLIHAVLSKLRPDLDAGCAGDALAARFRDLVAARLQQAVTTTELQRALTRIERQLLDQWATAYAEQSAAYGELMATTAKQGWQVLETEFPFGDVPGPAGEIKAPPLEFGASDRRVLIRGRIDRVDVARGNERPAFIVIDYKTGQRPRFKDQQIENGQALQLVLYCLAVKRLGLAPADAMPFQLGYWCLKETGFQSGLSGTKSSPTLKPLDAAVWQTLEQMVEDVIPRLAGGIRRSEFVVDSRQDDCTSGCEFRTVCRVNQIRPLRDRLQKVREEPAPAAPPSEPKEPRRQRSRKGQA